MSNRPSAILNQIGSDYNLYWTRRIEPVYSNNNFYNKDIYGVYGEFLPDGPEGPRGNNSSFNLQQLLNRVKQVNSGPCVLSEFTIQSTNGMGYVPFNFECECIEFPTDLDAGSIPRPPAGVVDIKNDINIQENINDGTISITKNIQVKGISTQQNPDPVSVAKTYATALSGNISNWKLPQISSKGGKNGGFQNPILLSDNHIVDIYNGTYSIQQSYVANLSQTYSQKQALIRNFIELQSGIDGIAVLNLKSTVVGGKDSDFNKLKSEIVSIQSPYNDIREELSSNVTFDQGSNTLEVNKIFTNDKSIDDGYKIINTISYNYDFMSENYSATTNSEARPITMQRTTLGAKGKLQKQNHKSIADDFNVIKGIKFFMYNKKETEGKDAPDVASYSEDFVSSPSIIVEGEEIKYKDLSVEVQYQAGFKKISATPLLSGAGKYYLEDLDYASNSQISVNVEGKFLKTAPSAQELHKYLDSGFAITQLQKTIMLDEKMYVDDYGQSFSYTCSKGGNDTKFKT